jgi:general stress protein 26
MPRTEIDTRFSEPGAAPTTWDEAARILDDAQLFWITTVRADGRPHQSPLVAVRHGGALYFCTGADEQKARNLGANAAVILTTGCNTWDRGLDVVVEGEAVRVTDDALLRELAAAWATKWDGSWQYDVRDGAFHHESGAALVFSVTPAKVLAFGKGSFTHTRHTF